MHGSGSVLPPGGDRRIRAGRNAYGTIDGLWFLSHRVGVRIRARRNQRGDGVGVPSLGGVVKRRGIEDRACIRVRTGRDQNRDGVGVPALGGMMKGRGIEYRARVRVRTGFEKTLQRSDPIVRRRHVKGRNGTGLVLRVDARASGEQPSDGCRVVGPDGIVQRAPLRRVRQAQREAWWRWRAGGSSSWGCVSLDPGAPHGGGAPGRERCLRGRGPWHRCLARDYARCAIVRRLKIGAGPRDTMQGDAIALAYSPGRWWPNPRPFGLLYSARDPTRAPCNGVAGPRLPACAGAVKHGPVASCDATGGWT